jgi:hypothetical protein
MDYIVYYFYANINVADQTLLTPLRIRDLPYEVEKSNLAGTSMVLVLVLVLVS